MKRTLIVVAGALMLALQPALAQNFDPARATSQAEKDELTRMVKLCKKLVTTLAATDAQEQRVKAAYDKDPTDANLVLVEKAERADFEARYQFQQNSCSERPL